MASAARKVAPVSDPKGRLVSIFVGAVLLPSIALSVVSFNAIPRQAEVTRLTLLKRYERVLYYVEEDLERLAQKKALKAAKLVGVEKLLDGRLDVIEAALSAAGWEAGMFTSLRLEASLPLPRAGKRSGPQPGAGDDLRAAVARFEPPEGSENEVSLAVTLPEQQVEGTLRYGFSCGYAHGRLIREYFEREFSNDRGLVIRVSEPGATSAIHETAPTPHGVKFELKRVMTSPSFRGLKLYLRPRDRTIEEDVRRLALAKTVLIGLIDLMLGAGLFLVYSNVRREMRLSKQKSDFVANVSHELKTPLALIRLYAETLEMGRVHGQGKAGEYYRVINKESQRLTQLINNILDFSRIEAGRREYRLAPAQLADVLADVIEAYRFQLEQQGFVVQVEIDDDLPEVHVDREALGQAVINLLNNALKYSRDDKRIRVHLRRERERLLLAVQDYGIGIAKAEQKKIFHTFYRAEDSLVHETRGSGLGLALVRHIMEAHGGSVEVDSSPGKGSTFTLELPLDRGPAGEGSGGAGGGPLTREP